MAEKLSVQIALEGGDEIARQLEGIGEAGQKAFADITSSAEQAGGFKNLKPEEVTKKLEAMGVTGVDAIDKIQAAVRQAGKLETLVEGITSVETGMAALARAAPLAGAAIAGAFVGATKAALAFAESVNKVSDDAAKLGVSIEKLDRFRAGLEQAGISPRAISSGLEAIQRAADQLKLDKLKQDIEGVKAGLAGKWGVEAQIALQGLNKAAEEFTPAGKAAREALAAMGEGIPGTTTKDVQELGSELAKLKGLGIDIEVGDDAITRAEKIIVALAKMPDQAKAAQIAMQQFGAAGPELVAALRTGSITIDQFRARFGALTAEQEAAANKMRQGSEQMSASWERLKVAIGAPIAIAGMAAITATFEAIRAIVQTTKQEFLAIWGVIDAGATVGAGVIAALAAPIKLVIDAVIQLGAALAGITWDAISSAGAAAWQAVVQKAGEAKQAVMDFAASLPGVTWDAISSAGAAAWQAVVQKAGEAKQAVMDFAASLPGVTWDAISSAGAAAWQAIVQKAGEAKQAVMDFAASLPGVTWDAISSAGAAAWQAIVQAVAGAKQAVVDFAASLPSIGWEALKSAGVAAWQAIIDKVKELIGLKPSGPSATGDSAPGKARGGLLGGRGTGTSDSNLAWLSRGEYIMPAGVVAKPGVASFLEALRRSSGRIPGFAKGGAVGSGALSGINSIGSFVGRALQSAATVLMQMHNTTLEGLKAAAVALQNSLASASRTLINALASVGAAQRTSIDGVLRSFEQVSEQLRQQLHTLATSGGKARGGLLGGRGTGTSDSNLAWVSRGEHIMPARAVAQPGVLAFLEALRRSGGNLSRVLDGMGRFALGGMVPRAIPAFATGGLSGGSNVTIQFPGLPAIGGLRASSDVVDQLHKAAALAQVRSGGRKPSRYS